MALKFAETMPESDLGENEVGHQLVKFLKNISTFSFIISHSKFDYKANIMALELYVCCYFQLLTSS